MTTIALILLTWGGNDDRREYARRTLTQALANIRTEHRLIVHIADDGSPVAHRGEMRELAAQFGFQATITDSQGRGYGANWNEALRFLRGHADYHLVVEDDWTLSQELDLDPLVRAFETEEHLIGCIRLGYLGTTQPLYGLVSHIAGRTYLLLDSESPEPHVFSGHPRLQSAKWADYVGPWPEALPEGGKPTPGETEFMVAHMLAARLGGVWPLDLPGLYASGTLFNHIGTVKSEVMRA